LELEEADTTLSFGVGLDVLSWDLMDEMRDLVAFVLKEI